MKLPSDAVPEPGAQTAFEADGRRLAIANVGGTLFVFSDLCPHRQCSLADGSLMDAVVTCPCHGSQFDVRTGERLRGPAVRAIAVFAVREQNGELHVVVG